ncbi:MAG: hypothetical protein J7J72_05580 [Bacteroidales bacterium]|nr:hypothetical protein [Bacteroidales bacterium]
MITWPIFVALFLAIIAVFISVKIDDTRNAREKQKLEKDEPEEEKEYPKINTIKRNKIRLKKNKVY